MTRRTRSQVLGARKHAVMGGCCERFADQKACDCLRDANPDDPPVSTDEQIRSDIRDCYATAWWDDVLRAENPAPVGQAFDRLRERLDTDDTGALRRLLYAAAGERMGEHRTRVGITTPTGSSETQTACQSLGNGDLVRAKWQVSGYMVTPDGTDHYSLFINEFNRVLDVCRELEALP